MADSSAGLALQSRGVQHQEPLTETELNGRLENLFDTNKKFLQGSILSRLREGQH
jgi:hypothetical protein